MTKTAKILWTFLGACVLIFWLSVIHWLATPPATMRIQEPLPVADFDAVGMAKGSAAWYRIPLHLSEVPPDGMALFIPFPMANFQTHLNGRDLTPPISVGAAGSLVCVLQPARRTAIIINKRNFFIFPPYIQYIILTYR